MCLSLILSRCHVLLNWAYTRITTFPSHVNFYRLGFHFGRMCMPRIAEGDRYGVGELVVLASTVPLKAA